MLASDRRGPRPCRGEKRGGSGAPPIPEKTRMARTGVRNRAWTLSNQGRGSSAPTSSRRRRGGHDPGICRDRENRRSGERCEAAAATPMNGISAGEASPPGRLARVPEHRPGKETVGERRERQSEDEYGENQRDRRARNDRRGAPGLLRRLRGSSSSPTKEMIASDEPYMNCFIDGKACVHWWARAPASTRERTRE